MKPTYNGSSRQFLDWILADSLTHRCGTRLELKGTDQVKVGDYLRYTDVDGRRYWAQVEDVPDEWERTNMDVVASDVYMTLDIRHKLWVATPQKD